MKNKNKRLTSFEDHLDSQYGKKGSCEREKYENEFEDFKKKIINVKSKLKVV